MWVHKPTTRKKKNQTIVSGIFYCCVFSHKRGDFPTAHLVFLKYFPHSAILSFVYRRACRQAHSQSIQSLYSSGLLLALCEAVILRGRRTSKLQSHCLASNLAPVYFPCTGNGHCELDARVVSMVLHLDALSTYRYIWTKNAFKVQIPLVWKFMMY